MSDAGYLRVLYVKHMLHLCLLLFLMYACIVCFKGIHYVFSNP